MSTMTDNRAVEVLAAMAQGLPSAFAYAEKRTALNHAIARLREPAEAQDKWKALIGKWQRRVEAVGYHGVEDALDAAVAAKSAPVGVPSDILRIVDTAIDVCNDRDRPAMAEDLEAVRLYVEQASAALAQQPPASEVSSGDNRLIPPVKPPAEAQRCTCPSGDGSLRWPCPVHPPEAQAQGGGEVDQVRLDLVPWLYVIRSEFLPDDDLDRESDKKMREALDWAIASLPAHPAKPPSPPVGLEVGGMHRALSRIAIGHGNAQEIAHAALAEAALTAPPSAPAAQGGGEVVAWFPTNGAGEILRNYGDGSPVYACKTKEQAEQVRRCHLGAVGPVIPLYAAPTSMPVGVVEAITEVRDFARSTLPGSGIASRLDAILVQQPTAVDGSMLGRVLRTTLTADLAPSAPVGVPVDVVREYLDARACYEAATRRPNSHAPAPVLKHGDPVVLRLREARVALDNALAQQPAYQRMQPCGCVLCVCEDEKRCHGCGAKHCGNRTDHPAYVTQQPAAVDGADAQAAEIEALRGRNETMLRAFTEREAALIRRAQEAEARAERLAEACQWVLNNPGAHRNGIKAVILSALNPTT